MLSKQPDTTLFDRATKNLNAFAENYMLLWSCWSVVQSLGLLEDREEEDPSKELMQSIAEETLKHLFNFVLERDNGLWN